MILQAPGVGSGITQAVYKPKTELCSQFFALVFSQVRMDRSTGVPFGEIAISTCNVDGHGKDGGLDLINSKLQRSKPAIDNKNVSVGEAFQNYMILNLV